MAQISLSSMSTGSGHMKLNGYVSLFAAEYSMDSKLHENSDLIRGCGGVGVMFWKSLSVSPISGISSDCISDPQCLSVLRMYLPCANQGMDAY